MVMTHESVKKTKKQQRAHQFYPDCHDSKKNAVFDNTPSWSTYWVTESCFEPLLFSIFANGILYVQKKNANMAIYMDNTTVHVSADSIESVNSSLQQELMLVSHWIVKNKFRLKFNKSH